MLNVIPQFGLSTPRDLDFKKLDSTLPMNDSTTVSVLKTKLFYEVNISKTFLYLVLNKTLTKLWPDHNHFFFLHENKIYRIFFFKTIWSEILNLVWRHSNLEWIHFCSNYNPKWKGEPKWSVEVLHWKVYRDNLLKSSFQKLLRKVETFVELFSGYFCFGFNNNILRLSSATIGNSYFVLKSVKAFIKCSRMVPFGWGWATLCNIYFIRSL